jgi:teichuronic acid biosynthesis glycosyltransferase TuaG
MPKFSVVIPCYNSSETISVTLQSCLDQEFSNFEILLVDDCSEDNTGEICLEFSRKFNAVGICFKYFRLETNHGVSYARNFGWNNALGDYICFLDSDDVWHRNKLQVVDLYLKYLNVTCLFHPYTDDIKRFSMHFDLEHSKFPFLRKGVFSFLIRNPSQTSCFIVRRNISYRFNERMSYCEDYDLCLRLSLRESVYALMCHPLTLLGRPQLTPGGLSSNRLKMRRGEMTTYFNLCNEVRYFYPVLPALLLFSLIKHVRSEILVFATRGHL